jgi:16S rRNA C967 or C1407 C5-methylase (RsmB/RsmF family)/NOL1/NOP2/fmu family ribosome biogenesis protein
MPLLPEALINDLQSVQSFDEAAFKAAHHLPAVTSVRLNPNKPSAAFEAGEAVPWCGIGKYLSARPVFTLDPLYHAGAYYVQEASSMFLAHAIASLVPDRTTIRVMDLCAAPGGKSTLIASLLGKDSLLISNEVIRTRASILEENMTRWGNMNTWVCSNDPKDVGKLHGYFDLMVVDAPCSGSGLFRKDEKALDEWSEANVNLCSQRQQRILADVWPALKQDGILIYATCSYSPQEDEEILDWLHETFSVTSLPVALQAEWGIVESTSRHGLKGYRFSPDKLKGEGFFLAAIRKDEEAEVLKSVKFKPVTDKKITQQAAHLLAEGSYALLSGVDREYTAINALHEADWNIVKNIVFLRKIGINIGQPSAKEWIPAHELALSIDKNKSLPAIEVSREQALLFLKKEDFKADLIEKGWYLVTYEGLALGWIKWLGNRVNNYLPKSWRIRMQIPDEDQL